MTESPDTPSGEPPDRRETANETPETRPPTMPPPPPWTYPAGPYPYPAGPYPGWYPPPQPYPGIAAPPAAPKNGLGIASLVIAIVGLVTAFSVIGGVILGIVAVVLGFVGYDRVRRRQADNGGIAIAGMVLGCLAIVAGIVSVFILAALWRTVGGDDFLHCLRKAGPDRAAQQRCAERLHGHVAARFSVTVTPSPPGPSPT